MARGLSSGPAAWTGLSESSFHARKPAATNTMANRMNFFIYRILMQVTDLVNFAPMLAGLQNVTFEFGARIIVKDATWHIQPNERIGLIGYNGTGKSTLLKLFAGEYLPSAGSVERSRSTTIGYLHQDLLSFDTYGSI